MNRYTTLEQAIPLFDTAKRLYLRNYLRAVDNRRGVLTYAVESLSRNARYHDVQVKLSDSPLETLYACDCDHYRRGAPTCIHIAYVLYHRHSQIRDYVDRRHALQELLPALRRYNDGDYLYA
jgi:hypothetical protein